MEGFLYHPKEYASAIRLALNCSIDGIIIHDFMYHEEKDVWYVELTDPEWGHLEAIPLQGNLVRSCYKAVQMGTTRWT